MLLSSIMNNETNETKIKSIEVQARRWFQKSFGNTYFSGELYINEELICSVNFEYGYDEQCIHNLTKLAQKKGALPSDPKLILWRFCSDNNIELLTNIVDVKRKKDL